MAGSRQKSSLFDDLFVGALSSGVNKSTLLLLNVVLLVLLAALLLLAYQASKVGGSILYHSLFLLILGILLVGLINWFIHQVGLVSVEEQKAELFGDAKAAEEDSDQHKKDR